MLVEQVDGVSIGEFSGENMGKLGNCSTGAISLSLGICFFRTGVWLTPSPVLTAFQPNFQQAMISYAALALAAAGCARSSALPDAHFFNDSASLPQIWQVPMSVHQGSSRSILVDAWLNLSNSVSREMQETISRGSSPPLLT